MDKIRVLYDYQTFHTQRFGGISRYFYELMTRATAVLPQVALRCSMNQYIRHYDGSGHLYVPKTLFKVFEGVFRKLNRNGSLSVIGKGNYDVFHPTYYNPYFLETLDGKPFVLTIHDMTHERFPQYFGERDLTKVHKRLLAEHATRIIAISESTKRDIVDILGIDEAKIDVIYHGLGTVPVASGCPAELRDCRYVLYVGERRRYKNFEATARAFARLVAEDADLQLVMTGRSLAESERKLFAELGISANVKVYTDVSDDVLMQLYHNARLFVYPSLYEGFGIPILEAFSQDCPVVLSKASCFPEVAGDAAVYFAAESVEEQAESMRKVLADDDLRAELIAKGRQRLSLFTWEETVRRTEETYRKALAK